MKKKPETVEKRLEKLEELVGILREAVDLLKDNCGCTIKERMSGHLVDCGVPHVKELMKEYGQTARA